MATAPQTPVVTHEAYIKNGLLYNNFYGEFTSEKSYDVQKRSLELLGEKKIDRIPIIVYLKDIDKSGFKLSMSSYGKVIAGFDLIKRASGIWIVNNNPDVKKIASLVSKVFFSNHLRIVDTLEEAEKEAGKLVTASESILEQTSEN
jgi:hypothetical protein